MSVVANVAINVDSSGAVSKLRQVQQGAQATSQAVDKLNATTAATSDKFKIAANGIKYFTDAAGRARAENGRFLTTAERAAAGIKLQGDAAQQASGKLNGLRNALAGIGAGFALRKSFIDASELESAQSRIGLLSKNFQQLTGIQDVASNAARKFNLSQTESLSALTDLGNRIGPTGASLEDVANVYEGFNTLLALNKVNSQNAASATLQLNQALGSGRLAGEEFNAISEATPQLLDAVAKVLGRNRGELKQLASDGQISSQVLIEALKRIRTEGAADLEASFGGAFGATRRFNAALEDFSATVGTELLPALTPVINAATELLKQFGQLPSSIKTTVVVITGLAAAFTALAPAISATIALKAGVTAALGATAASAATAATSVGVLKGAMLAIPGAGWTAAAIIGLGLLGKAVFDTNETFRNFVNNIGGVVASDFRSAVDGMADDAKTSASNIQKAYEELPPGLNPIAKFIRELFQGAFKDTSNAAETSAAVSSNAFNDFFNGLASQGAAGFNGLSAIINNWWSNLPAPIRNIFSGNAVSMLAGAAGAAGSAASRASAPNAQATGIYGRYGAPSSQVPFAKKTPAPNAMGTPIGATVGGGSSKGTADSDAKRAADEAKRAAEQMQQQLKAADDINFALKNRLAIAQVTEPVAKRMLEYDIKQNEIAKEYDELKKAAKSADELALINANLIIENRIAQIESEQQINDLLAERAILMADVMRQAGMPTVYNELETQEAALQAVLDKYPAIGAAANAAATLATSGMSEIIAGTKSAEQVFAEFLNAIGDALINTAKQMIASYIAIGIAKMFADLGSPAAGGFAPSGSLAAVGNINPLPTSFTPRANGGPVAGGTPYLVGERGPELFMPGTGGSVVNNNDLRSAMGGRPGGANGSPVLNMSFQSTTINGVEYVSRDQLEAAMAQTRRQAAKDGANRGMNMTLDKIQNSPSTRSRVGIR